MNRLSFQSHPVFKPSNDSDCGISIIQYALSMAKLDSRLLNENSFKLDKHQSVFLSSHVFSFNDTNLQQLRMECLKCICRATEKYCIDRIDDDTGETDDADESDSDTALDEHSCATGCCSCNKTCVSSGSAISDDSSHSSDYDTTDHEDSDFVLSDCELEVDADGNMDGSNHDDTSSITSGCSSFAMDEPTTGTGHGTDLGNDIDLHSKDILLCPGDVIEYKNKKSSAEIKRNAIVTIVCNDTERYIVLDNGFILHKRKYWVRKVKMYSAVDKSLLPNPYAEWSSLDTCLFQNGHIDKEDDDHGRNGTSSNRPQPKEKPVPRRERRRLKRNKRMRTSEGLTNNIQRHRMRRRRREQKQMDSVPNYPKFDWVEKDTEEYYDAIDTINECYRKMLKIGKARAVFREAKDDVSNLLKAKTKKEFLTAKKNIEERYKRNIDNGCVGVLHNFKVKTELIPNPRKYQHQHQANIPTEREIIAKEEILAFEQYLSSLNVFKCSICLECHILEKPLKNSDNFQCKSCKDRKDPNYYLRNNLHPVWYLVDDNGNYLKDDNGDKIPQYHIPHQLSCLTSSEKLLIRRCANFVPCIHLKNGMYGIKGHCVTFPQNIAELCDELPLRRETVVTFLRNIGNKETDAIQPTTLKVNRTKVLTALHWLKKHNVFYKDIKIREENLDWMEGEEEVSITKGGIEFDLDQTKNSKKRDEEQEHVSKSHGSADDDDSDNEDMPMQMFTVHANAKQTVPSGKQAEPIKELIDIAKKTNQTSKIMKFPPIDHDSPLR